MRTDHPRRERTAARTGERAGRPTEYALIGVFLGLIAAVPVSQTAVELARRERVQFTDVLRQVPTAANFRRYEETLKEKSWVQRIARPTVQRVLFHTLGDAGAKAVRGTDGWLFYRPDVRYLVEGNRPDRSSGETRWVEASVPTTQRESVVRAICRVREQLRERGILLLVVPVPGKPSAYPERLTTRATPLGELAGSPTRELLADLERQGVPAVDLLSVFRQQRSLSDAGSLYLAHDTHWTPLGARLAADAVAARLTALGQAPPPTTAFRTATRTVERRGDILEMMQIPGLSDQFLPERVTCEQVLDPALGPLVPGASERPGAYRYPAQRATVLVLGDSFSRIYQYAEPRSLGTIVDAEDSVAPGGADRGTPKRLLPGSAGFVSHLARALQAPVDAIVSDGGASTDVRRKLSVNPEILEGKRVVVWEFVERDIALGQIGWADVPLPADLGP